MRSGIVTTLIIVAACVVPQYGDASVGKIHAPPTTACDSDHAGDLHIGSQGVWFECVCERLQFTGDLCDWYELGPAPDAGRAARRWNYISPRALRSLAIPHRWPVFLPSTRVTVIRTGSSIGATIPPVVIGTVPAPPAQIMCNDPYLADDAWAQAHGC